MKKNLRSACLLFLVFLSIIAGFTGRGSAVDDYNYSFNETNYTGKWDKNFSSPASEYKIWGYPNKNYNFTTTYNHSLFSDKRVVIFYWDCKNNTSDHTPPIPMSGNCSDIDGAYRSNCTNKWDKTGTYYVSVAIYQDGKPINVSYWTTVEIRNNTCITVQNFSMLNEKEGFDSNNSAHIYNISNFSEIMHGEKEVNCSNSTYNVSSLENSSKNRSYCGYVDNDYSFSVNLNAISVSSEDNRTINETTTVVEWDDTTSDNSILRSIYDNNVSINTSDNENTKYIIEWNENFTHWWDKTGQKNINANFFHWDPLDGNEMHSNNNTKSILIIQDPKSFVFYPLKGVSFNLHNWGIFLSIIGLIIFYFTYTRNNVPIEISIFGLKPFYLRSVNSLTGTLIFVAGFYLYFVFGRCPWDISFVSNSDWLSNMYFSILYREYETKPIQNIPYISILIGMLDVIILSLIIHLTTIPFYKGVFKIGELLRVKHSSTSVQPEMISYSVENKTNR